MTFHTVLKETKMNINEFAKFYNIPYKTVYAWHTLHRFPPRYVLELLLYKWRNRFFLNYFDATEAINFKYFKKLVNEPLVNMCRLFNINYDTMQRWNTGLRVPPNYVIGLMWYKWKVINFLTKK